MTANQLALASLREATRHNMAGEAETNRHNVESENIEAEKNRLTELSINLTDERERQKNQYQKEYNDLYISYLNASETEKEWYEWKMSNLKEAELQYEAKYKEDMTRIQDQLAYWQGQSVQNDAKYKQAWKEMQLLNADLEAKRIEYEATLKREQIESNERIQHSINALTEWKNTADYILRMESVSQEWADLRRRTQETQLKTEQQEEVLKNMHADTNKKRSETVKNYWNAILDTISTASQETFRWFDQYLGGNTYGKTKKAAEALFSD